MAAAAKKKAFSFLLSEQLISNKNPGPHDLLPYYVELLLHLKMVDSAVFGEVKDS